MEPRTIVGVEDKPILIPGTQQQATRLGGAEPVRRTVRYNDGSYEIFEFDQRNPPPSPGEPWGSLVQSGIDPQQASRYRAEQAAAVKAVSGAPDTVGGGPAGTLVYNPTTGRYEAIPGTAPREPANVTASGGTFWRYNPLTEQMEMVGANPLELAERQATATRQAAQDQAAAGRQVETDRLAAARFQLDVIQQAERAGEIDAKRAAELRDYLYKTEVELPQKLREQEDVRLAAGIERGRHAGEAAVSDITAQLPYRYSPGFTARQQAVGAEAARGNFTPGIYGSIARAYRGPDLQGARQQAERGYESQYLQQFGFDPLETAGQVPYRAPGPGAPAAPLGLGDDEEEIKRLAAMLAGR